MDRRRVSAAAAALVAVVASTAPASARADGSRDGARPRSVHVKLLALNDFHGHLLPGTERRGEAAVAVGGAAVLATHLRDAQRGPQRATFIVHAGDLVGASPAESALLGDEPTVTFLNTLANADCWAWRRLHPGCNIVGTIGNHELDHGHRAMLRLLHGGSAPEGPLLEEPWRGARYPTVVANVVYADTGHPILPPHVVKRVDGVPIAFIGALVRGAPSFVSASGIRGLSFLDEADAVNAQVRTLRRDGVRAFVVMLHQGGSQEAYAGQTDAGVTGPREVDVIDVVRRLDDDVDVVVSGHSHAFTNALVRNARGRPILVTQALSHGAAYAEIELTLDRRTRDVVARTAAIRTTAHVAGDGRRVPPDPEVEAVVRRASAAVAALASRVVGATATDLTRAQDGAGESTLGDLVADAQRARMGTDFAFVNPGGIRADLPLAAPDRARAVTWGDLHAIQPFGNPLVKLTLTYAQLEALLEQQWDNPAPGEARLLQVSGLSYEWDPRRPVGHRVVEIRKDGALLDRAGRFTAAVNAFLADGADGFTALRDATDRSVGPRDLSALVWYVQERSPLHVATDGRIRRRRTPRLARP